MKENTLNQDSDSGPIGRQIHKELGLQPKLSHDDLWPQTRAAIEQRGYTRLKRIAGGGYGVVISARHASTGAQRAIKVVREPDNETSLHAFQRECRILSTAELPSGLAPQFYEQELSTGIQPFLVQEWLDGETLENYISSHPSLSMKQREFLCEMLFRVYDRLHQANLLHRDVSARNIMISKGQIRLIDFGSAGRKDEGYVSLNTQSRVPLTPGYASDEMLKGETRGSVEHEVHAIAKVAFLILTGQRADRLPAQNWKSTMLKQGCDPHVVSAIVLPRMQQPPEKLVPIGPTIDS